MTHHFNARNIFIALVLAVGAFAVAVPAQAQDSGQQQPADGASDSGQDDSAYPSRTLNNPHVQQTPAKPLPAGLPTTEKSGDNLIVHSASGDYTIPDFMKTIGPGQAGNVNVGVPGHGNCDLKVDSSGTTVDAKCDQ